MKQISFFIIAIVVVSLLFAPISKAHAVDERQASQVIQDKTKTYVLGPLGKLFAKIDAWRIEMHLAFVDKKKEAKDKLNDFRAHKTATEQAVNSDNPEETYKKTTYIDSSAGNPFDGAKLVFFVALYSTLIFIFASVLWFYLIGGLIILLILRMIWNNLL